MSIKDVKQIKYYVDHYEYYDIDNNFLGYTVRVLPPGETKKVKPWIRVNDELINQWHKEGTKPIFQAQLLKRYPDKPVLIVEGEKTCKAATELFPDFVVISWLGGSNAAKKVDFSVLEDRIVYMVPDADKPGYDAADAIYEQLKFKVKEFYFVDILKLGVSKSWDLADFEKGEVDFEDVKQFIYDCKQTKLPTFDQSTYPDLSDHKKPKPLDTTENLTYLLNNFKIKVRWNMMKRIREILVPNLKFYNEEAENAALTYVTNLAILNNFPIHRIDKHLDAISWENPFHPVRDWLLSKPLANKGLFEKFLTNIQTTNNELSYILLKRWMISVIAALFNEGNFCAQGVLVIQGAGGTHKSSFIASLMPDELRAIKGGCSLDPSRKDDILTLSEYLIVELGELDATFRKSDIARLKAHITNDIDSVRRPYAVRNSQMIRRTVYAATVNESRFLVDSTGNRRWLTVSVTEGINTRHGMDMQQVWRELYDMWLAGESPTLLDYELKWLNIENESYEMLDPFDEKLDIFFDFETPDRQFMTATEVLGAIGYDKPSKSDCNRMAAILIRRNMPRGNGKLRRSYSMPRSRFDKLNSNA